MTFSIIKKSGFTLVEVLVYTAGATLLIGVIVGFMFYMFRWYEKVSMPARADQIATIVIGRLMSDIRASIEAGNESTLATTTLVLITRAPTGNTQKTYSVQDGKITFQEESESIQYLTPNTVEVDSLSFQLIPTPHSKAIRFEMQFNYQTKNGIASSTYSGTAIMRNSYE